MAWIRIFNNNLSLNIFPRLQFAPLCFMSLSIFFVKTILIKYISVTLRKNKYENVVHRCWSIARQHGVVFSQMSWLLSAKSYICQEDLFHDRPNFFISILFLFWSDNWIWCLRYQHFKHARKVYWARGILNNLSNKLTEHNSIWI